MRILLLVLILTLASTGIANACNWRQLMEDMKWCLDVPDRDGRDDIILGAYNKDARKVRSGFRDCQSHSNTAKDNFDNCTAGQQIDAARAVLGIMLINDVPKAFQSLNAQ